MNRSKALRPAAAALSLVLSMLAGPASAQDSCAAWTAGLFGAQEPGGPVSALTVFDDGSGAALYAAGSFESAGGAAARRIARWNGEAWSALGSGLNGNALALA